VLRFRHPRGGRIQNDRHRFGRRMEKVMGASAAGLQAEKEEMQPGGERGSRCESFHGD
jgi:hypothetical protein